MKFGVQLPTFGDTASAQLIVRSARLAEDLGYDSIWTNDHVMVPPRLAIPYRRMLECLVTLATTIPITRRVRLGTSVVVVPQRHPVLLAKQAAALDMLSGGRLVLGVGAGYVQEEFQFLGADFAHRGEVLEESVRAMRALWRDGGGAFEGRWVTFRDAIFEPRPVQGERIPIWLGGNSTATIRRAARWADAWHPGALSPHELAEGAALLRHTAAHRSVAVTLKLRAEFPGVGGADKQRSPNDFSHSHDLRGGPEEMCRELEQYARGGLEHLVLFFYHAAPEELERSMVIFAEKVMPEFRDSPG